MEKKQTSIYLDRETLDKLCEIARLKKLSRSSLVRTMINEVDCQQVRSPTKEINEAAAKS